VRDLTITNMGEGGVQFQRSDHVVAVGNTIAHAGYTFGWGSGIGLWFGGEGSTSTYGPALGFHAVIADNEISDITDASTYLTDGNGIIVDGGGALYPVLMTGNVVHDVRGRGITSIYNSGDLWVVNNTVVNASNADKCTYASYSLQAFTGRAHWFNNISAPGCGPNYSQFDGSTGYTWRSDIDTNTRNTNLSPTAEVMVIDPLLDPTTFEPRAGSPALGNGIEVGVFMTDAMLNTGASYLATHGNIGAR